MASGTHQGGNDDPSRLLGAGDPAPVTILNAAGAAPFLLIGDHAGNRIPVALGDLGLDEAERERHIAWDIGIAGLGEMLAEALDAPFVRQIYSRLVVDCNRRPDAPDAIAAVSDATVVPGNQALSAAQRAARFAAIHEPYQQAIAALLAERDAVGRATVLVALHSFTPAMARDGSARPWQIGILHDAGNARFARALLEQLRMRGELTVGDNEPYRMDLIDYTVPRHAYAARRPYAEIEVRQDLLATEAQQAGWSALLAEDLAKAWRHWAEAMRSAR